ncbi:MAG: DotI/IcmL/TraM family protein [Burkholderiales bacterium]|nr:DotI/IcmL/TraM family protein [Burkholderiales bacterium]
MNAQTGRPQKGVQVRSEAVRLGDQLSASRDVARRLATGIALAAGVGLLGLSAAIVTVLWRPKGQYFGLTPSLQVVKMVPMSEPFISEQGLLDWTSESVCKTLGLDFVHWRDELLAVQSDYTPQAFAQVEGQLESSGTLDMVRKERILMSAVPSAPPVIIAEGVAAGHYTWRIQFPVIVSYETTGGQPTKQTLVATATVVRVPTEFNPRGVAIEQINLLQGSSTP